MEEEQTVEDAVRRNVPSGCAKKANKPHTHTHTTGRSSGSTSMVHFWMNQHLLIFVSLFI